MATLPDYDSLWEPPKNQIEKFLSCPPDDPQFIQDFPLVYARLATQSAQLKAKLSVMKLDRTIYHCKAIEDYQKKKDPTTDKYYTLAAAERKLERDPIVIEYRTKEAELIRRISIFEAYADSLEYKANTVPGSQGRANAYMKASMKGNTNG